MQKNKILITFIIFLILIYILWNTGIHGDDFIEINYMAKFNNINDFLYGSLRYIYGPINYLIFYWVYPVLGSENLFIYDIIKIICHLFSIFLIFKFASDYLPNDRALLVSVLFIFFPTHDSTIFWYMTAPYTFIPALIMYCHHLMRTNKLLLTYPLLLAASFASYLTPPCIIGLSFIFFLEKSYKKFLLFLSPAIIYIIYYLIIAITFTSPESMLYDRKIDDDLSIIKFFKVLFLQILSAFDVFFGPSFILKIFSSIYSLSLISFLLTLPIIFLLKFYLKSNKPIIYKPLLIGLILVFLLSCCMFALTGMYTQIAFNLGNRVTIYGSLIVAFILSIMPFSKKFLVFIAIIFILPLFGLSDHWKNWNVNQKIIINNIQTNNDLINTKENDIIVIKGNAYSKLGSFSHIEFFSMPWNVEAIFYATVKSKNVVALSRHIHINNNQLIDTKSQKKTNLTKNLFLYDSVSNTVTKINTAKLKSMIELKESEIRHWLQIVENKYLKSLLFYLSPRLEYLFY